MTISKRFEVKLKDTSEKIIEELPLKFRSQFVREAIINYADYLGRINELTEKEKECIKINHPTLKKIFFNHYSEKLFNQLYNKEKY